jgi:hypothetical protein
LETCLKDADWCFGYSLAIVDAVAGLNDPNAKFCIPNGVTAGQLKDLFVKTLEDTPEWRHMPAPYTFIEKLVALYPCH